MLSPKIEEAELIETLELILNLKLFKVSGFEYYQKTTENGQNVKTTISREVLFVYVTDNKYNYEPR